MHFEKNYSMDAQAGLALNGGTPVRSDSLPPRGLIGEAEKAAAIALFDEAISTGQAFGYQGPSRSRYEKNFSEFHGGGHAVGVNSGSNALYCALAALRLDPYSEVIVPPISDPGGVMPVALLGCVPVIADSDPRSFNLSAETIEPLLTERTRAIVVAHISGEPAEMDSILELAKKHDLRVVEDCAQAHGATYKGRMVGTFGDLAAFSTMFGKHHCTGGQGGVVYTRHPCWAESARWAADRGKHRTESGLANVVAALNCNMDDLSAAIGCVQLEKLPRFLEERKRIGGRIRTGLAEAEALSMGWQAPETDPVYWFLRLRLDLDKLSVDKATFCEALRAEVKGLGVMTEYRFIQCFSPWFKKQAVFGNSGFPWSSPDYAGEREPHYAMPNAQHAADVHFGIPIHENLGERETEELLEALLKVEKAYLKAPV